jgi:hypothetical protein
MRPEFLKNLRVRSDSIGERWEILVREAATDGRLGGPEPMVQTIPAFLESIFAALAKPARGPMSVAAQRARIPDCPCGRNVALANSHAAERALVEAIQRLQAELPSPARRTSDIGETMLAVRSLARTAVNAHCETCAHRTLDPECRFRFAASDTNRR